jgi:hypothetical protein
MMMGDIYRSSNPKEKKMITFNEFVEHKRLEGVIAECANMMADMDVEPHRYIYESLKRVDPVLAEGWWDGVQKFARNVGTGVKQFFTNVGQGAKAGYNQAADTIAGPAAKFDAAARALADLEKVLSNPQFANFMSSTGRGSVLQYVQQVKKDLEEDRNAMPQRTDTKVSQPYDKSGNVEAQRSQVAAGQQPTRQSSVLGADGSPMVVPAAS